MQKSPTNSHNSSAAHRRVQHSSTLNRKYVHRPTTARARSRSAATASAAEAEARAIRAVQKAQIQKRRQAQAAEMNRSYPAAAKRGQVSRQPQQLQKQQLQPSQRQQLQPSQKLQSQQSQKLQQSQQIKVQRQQRQQAQQQDLPPRLHPMQARAIAAQRAQKQQKILTAQQRKDAAIQSALRSVATMDQQNTITSQNISNKSSKKQKKIQSRHTRSPKKGSGKRFLIAFTCAAACVAAITFLITANAPDLSVRVAAIQTGIDAAYPSYIPRDYSLTDVLSEDGKITMKFSSTDSSFLLTEQQSSWDTATLLSTYVKPTWGENYTATHEQGITIYMSGSNAVWVNGSIFYTIADDTGTLTKKQIRNIITSL